MADAIQSIADWLFMPYIVAVLLGAGVFLTVRLGFVQFRRFPEALRATVAAQSRGEGALTPFQAFMTALAASVGTGNIAGVATAIITGGPGALFWIWVYGFVATAIKFAEAVLGIRFRQVRGDVVQSGPMYYLRDGLKSPALAWIYALVAGVAALTTTPFTQPNSIAVAVNSVFGVPTWIVGVVVAVLTWAVIIGGIKSIGRAAEKLAPLKVGLYLVGGAVVIISFADRLPYVFSMVFREALTTQSAMGFGMFIAMRYGIARSIYANEAGYGTAAVAYGTARSDQPSQQGLQAVMEVLIVSFVTATISAMTILVSGVAEESIAARAGRRHVSHQHRRGRRRLQRRDSDGRRLGRRLLRFSLRLHDADRLGLLRRAIPRIHLRPQRHGAVSLDLLPADSVRCGRPARSRLGVGRSDERAPGISEPHRPHRPERYRRHVCAAKNDHLNH